MSHQKETGEITYKALLEADKGGDTVYARGHWWRAKAKTGGRVWYTPDGMEAVAETPAGVVYGSMLFVGFTPMRSNTSIFTRLWARAAKCRAM